MAVLLSEQLQGFLQGESCAAFKEAHRVRALCASSAAYSSSDIRGAAHGGHRLMNFPSSTHRRQWLFTEAQLVRLCL